MTSLRDTVAHTEFHDTAARAKLNWLRAAVLGANDGIVSVSSVIVGVAGAVGEYVSVSTQRDTEKALLEKERWELENAPESELKELVEIYEKKGLSKPTAVLVAEELTRHNAFAAHVDAELGTDPNDLVDPWHAAYASGSAFFVGAIIPILAIVLSPEKWRVEATVISVVVALVVTGWLSAYAGGASKRTAIARVVAGGIIAMVITFGIGKLFGVVGI
jgi:VIT1/CCC1 family predicted Fe2+/Mn2+ transporter